MNPANEMAAKIKPTERQSAGALAGSNDKLHETLHVSPEDLLGPSPQRPEEDLHNLLLRISHHLDYETSERKTIYYRLQAIESQTKMAIESQMKGRDSGRFARYVVAICIGVAGTLAWQSYGATAKQIIVTKAPELGWSPEARQMIVSWVQELGWTKPPAGPENTVVRPSAPETPQAAPVAQIAPEAPKAPAAPSVDPEQVHQIALDLAAVRQTVEKLAASQDQIAREIDRLQAADVEILAKIPVPPPPRPIAAPARKPMPVSRAPMPPH